MTVAKKKDGGKLTTITGGRKKSTSGPTPEKRLPDIVFPEKLIKSAITPDALRKGSYQRKVLAACASFLAPDLMNSLRRSLHCDLPTAQRLTA